MLTRSSCLSFRLQQAGRCASSLNLRIWLLCVWLIIKNYDYDAPGAVYNKPV